MELTVQNVYGLLLRSRLLSLDDSKAMFARWQAEAAGGSADLARFASWMVAGGYVTEYQAGLLARGHADGFFIGDYKILDRVGKGCMAGVYKAQHASGQVVAIKILPPSKARDPVLLGRFQREAKLALRLDHPNTVRAFQVGSSGGLHYLVMEYLDGDTLEELLVRRGQLPVEEAVRLIYQALLGLQHIHEQGLVHRDLKPSNLMLVGVTAGSTESGTVKILDLGLGRMLFEEGADATDPGLTGEGVLLGTPDYMAPEQAADARRADVRADIYSLGCVLYHLLAGHPPFPDTNVISQMIRHASEPMPPLRPLNPAVPDGLQQIVHWMTAKDPAGRYPTPLRAAQGLEVFLAAGARAATATDVDPKMQTYLHWLETEGQSAPAEQAATPATPTTPATVLMPDPTPRPVSPQRQKQPPATSRRPAGQGKAARKRPPAPPPPPTDGSGVDVELVAVAPGPPAGKPAGPPWRGLTRRDFSFFFAGVVSGLIAYAAGRALAALLAH